MIRRSLILLRLLPLGLLALARPLAGQVEAAVEAIAPVLAAEDARRFDPARFRVALSSADSLVRRVAAVAVGRIHDPAGTALLLPLLTDRDSTVVGSAMFALGLLGDSSAAAPIIARLRDPAPLDEATVKEAVTALSRIGGASAAALFERVLAGAEFATHPAHDAIVRQALIDAWRLGRRNAPVDRLLRFTEDSGADIRWRAFYSLGRLRAPAAGDRFAAALTDENADVRAVAARTLTASYADSAGIQRETAVGLLVRLISDEDAGVRISALRSIGTYHLRGIAPKLLSSLDDPTPNVSVQAALVLGELGDPAAGASLARVADGKGTWAIRREALIALGKCDTAAFISSQAAWSGSGDWRDRAAAAEGWAAFAPGPRAGKPDFLDDPDGRVVAAALQAWSAAVDGPDPALLAAARARLTHPDVVVRSLSGDVVARAPEVADVPGLKAMYAMTRFDSIPDAALSALGALAALARVSASNADLVGREFVLATPRPADYLQRRWAEENWPQLAGRWGPARPIDTGRTLQDYRDLARRFIVKPSPDRLPHVFIETARGTIEVELYGPDAPMTVANFLRLTDRKFFDNRQWHRVVPNFVVQDGDPRGDGWGGPGGTIRDELNRRHFDVNMLGMALSGPDTGGSQWFITLSDQPHLDGDYTLFGKVVAGFPALIRITQGDLIRSVHR